MATQEPRSRYSEAPAGWEEAKRRTAQGCEAVQAYVQCHPVPVVVAAFGLGLGVGLWLGTQLIPKPVRELTLAEKVSRQILETLGPVLPERLASRLRA